MSLFFTYPTKALGGKCDYKFPLILWDHIHFIEVKFVAVSFIAYIIFPHF